MMNPLLKSQCNVKQGTVVLGKWHGNEYTILKELGYGANGVVYLAKYKNTQVAVKMSQNGMSIASEVNVLKSFAKVQGSTLGPSLLDVDDWKSIQGRISFYAMEYIDGLDLLTFIEQKGKSWTMVLFLQLLNDLEKIHENGWVFGDLKPENLIVSGPPTKIRCIDVGGTTIQGRAIKEFTEFFDRGYWGLGTRKAEPSYDLFAVGMIMLNTAYPKRFMKSAEGISQLREAIRKKSELLPLERVIVKSLQGQYTSAKQMRAELLTLAADHHQSDYIPRSASKKNHTIKQTSSENQKAHPYQSRQRYQRKKKKKDFFETIVIIMAFIFLYFMYFMWN